MESSGTRISEIEKYMKEKLTELHDELVSKGVPTEVVVNTDSLSISLVEFFLNSINLNQLANIRELDLEILKRNLSIKLAQTVIFACDKAIK